MLFIYFLANTYYHLQLGNPKKIHEKSIRGHVRIYYLNFYIFLCAYVFRTPYSGSDIWRFFGQYLLSSVINE